jgi:hypothetical protein
MWTHILLSLTCYLISGAVASPAPKPAATAAPRWKNYECDQWGDCGFFTDEEDATLYMTHNPPHGLDYYDGEYPYGKGFDRIKTVTVRPEYPTYTRCPDVVTITSIVGGGPGPGGPGGPFRPPPPITTTTTVTAPACASTQPITNQGFNGGSLAPWENNGDGGAVFGTAAYGLNDYGNATKGAAEFLIPLNSTVAISGDAAIIEPINLCPNSNYVFRFSAALPQPASLINVGLNTNAIRAYLANLLGTTVDAITNGLLSVLPLAAVGGCEVVVSIGGLQSQTFPLYAGPPTAPTPRVQLLTTDNTQWYEFDYYFNSGLGGNSEVELDLVCPGVNNIPTSTYQYLLTSTEDGGYGLAQLPDLLPDVTSPNVSFSTTTGQILNALSINEIQVLIDQVSIDYYN